MRKVWGCFLIAIAMPTFAVGVGWIIRDHNTVRGLLDMCIASGLFAFGLARLRGWQP